MYFDPLQAREFSNELRASTKVPKNPTVWLEGFIGSGQSANNVDTSNVSEAYNKMLTIFVPLLVDEVITKPPLHPKSTVTIFPLLKSNGSNVKLQSTFFAHFMCFEVPGLAPPGGPANGKNESNDDDANDDNLGIKDINDSDNKKGNFHVILYPNMVLVLVSALIM